MSGESGDMARFAAREGTSQSFGASSAVSRLGDDAVGIRWTRAEMPRNQQSGSVWS
jgi:hypothetical protein